MPCRETAHRRRLVVVVGTWCFSTQHVADCAQRRSRVARFGRSTLPVARHHRSRSRSGDRFGVAATLPCLGASCSRNAGAGYGDAAATQAATAKRCGCVCRCGVYGAAFAASITLEREWRLLRVTTIQRGQRGAAAQRRSADRLDVDVAAALLAVEVAQIAFLSFSFDTQRATAVRSHTTQANHMPRAAVMLRRCAAVLADLEAVGGVQVD